MMDRDAPLVDVMSFLFVFAVVVFVTSTNGALEKPGASPKLISVSLAPVQIPTNEISFTCAPVRTVNSGHLRFALFHASDEGVTSASSFFQTCTEGAPLDDRVLIYLSVRENTDPVALVLTITDLGRLSRIGQPLDLEIHIEGPDICQTKLYNLPLGKAAPLVMPLASGSTC